MILSSKELEVYLANTDAFLMPGPDSTAGVFPDL